MLEEAMQNPEGAESEDEETENQSETDSDEEDSNEQDSDEEDESDEDSDGTPHSGDNRNVRRPGLRNRRSVDYSASARYDRRDGRRDNGGSSQKRSGRKRQSDPSRRPRRARRAVERYAPPTPTQRQLAHSSSRDQRHEEQYGYGLSRAQRGRGGGGSGRHRRRMRLNAESTTENEWSDDFDDQFFERRRERSLRRARDKLQPLNSATGDDARVIQERMRAGGKEGADIDPMTIDKTATFATIGGLSHHVRALKEMVVFPLMYPEFFDRFKMDPPRGVLFYGPPGTGKTLCARALANECSKSGKHVSFFMRKGADCLSKWIGESERMLRLLFDQAYKMRPSIIFFDEIDGLAPVRSSRSDQAYSSIVSTLLAMMDGVDSRGEVVIIGATNRPDNIDPALRRPGRFDREFAFTLPSREARKQILAIHSRNWRPKLPDWFLDDLSERCEGYCGADLKALCSEAALLALGRTFPGIYDAAGKLDINPADVAVSAGDFAGALHKITPASNRSQVPKSKKVPKHIRPLLSRLLAGALSMVQRLIPATYAARHQVRGAQADHSWAVGVDIYSTSAAGGHELFEGSPYARPPPHRARMLLSGPPGMAHTTHLAPAILAELEKYPTRTVDLPSLFSDSAVRSAEEACVQAIREARRVTPSVLFMPRVDKWWGIVGAPVQQTIATMLEDIPASSEMLVLATSDLPRGSLPAALAALFSRDQCFEVERGSPEEERRAFFAPIFETAAMAPPAIEEAAAPSARGVRTRGKRKREAQLFPPALATKKLSESELEALARREDATLRQLRMYLRDVLDALLGDKKYKVFREPIDLDEVPDYADVVKEPLSLLDMLHRLNEGTYASDKLFLADVAKIKNNAYEYNRAEGVGIRIRNAASDLDDAAKNMIETALVDHSALFDECREIAESRKRRRHAHTTDELEAAAAVPAPTADPLLGEDDDADLMPGETTHADRTGAPGASLWAAASAASAGAEAAPAADLAQAGAPGEAAGKPKEPGVLVLDQDGLDALLADVLQLTERSTIDTMDTLSSKLRHAVFDHRMSYDKSALQLTFSEIVTAFKETVAGIP